MIISPKYATLTLDDVLTMTHDPCPLCASYSRDVTEEPCQSCEVIAAHGDWLYEGEIPSGFELAAVLK